jgi:hypothetical protein
MPTPLNSPGNLRLQPRLSLLDRFPQPYMLTTRTAARSMRIPERLAPSLPSSAP